MAVSECVLKLAYIVMGNSHPVHHQNLLLFLKLFFSGQPSLWVVFSFCLDVNECEGESICVDDGHHTCQNLVGSYRCVCDTGYQHPDNNLTLCEGKIFGYRDSLQSYP